MSAKVFIARYASPVLAYLLRIFGGLFFHSDAAHVVARLRSNRSANSIGAWGPLVPVLLAAEDHRFFYHPGIDVTGIVRAFMSNLARRPVQGASTLEQQLARQLHGDRRIRLRRKLKDAYIAVCMNRAFSKHEILGFYLHFVSYGHSMTGIGDAAEALGVDATNATTQELALLVACLKCPVPRHPSPRYWEILQKREDRILTRLHFLISERFVFNAQ